MTPDKAQSLKDELDVAIDKYNIAFKAKDYKTALTHADAIRDIGLSLGSDAWNKGFGQIKGEKK